MSQASISCKQVDCGSANVSQADLPRFACNDCGGVFVDLPEIREIRLPPLVLPRVRERLTRLPECFGNRDTNCALCQSECPSRHQCSRNSPPTGASYFSVLGITRIKGRERAKPTELSWSASHQGHLIQQARAVNWLTKWSHYFRTLRLITVSPTRFYTNAFSERSPRFHHLSSTLNPGAFLAYHVSFVSLVALVVGLSLPGLAIGHMDVAKAIGVIKPMAFAISVHLAFMYVPALLVVFFLRRTIGNTYRYRRVNLTGDPSGVDITIPNALRAVTYTAGFEIPAVVAAELFYFGFTELTADPLGDNAARYFMSGYLLGFVSKAITLLVFLPIALAYSCRVPWNSALLAGWWVFAVPLLTFTVLRILLMSLGVR